MHLLHLSGRDEGGHVDRHLSGKDTAEYLIRGVSEFLVDIVCPVIVLGLHLLHLRLWDEGGNVDRHLSGKDTAESVIRWCLGSW